MKYRLLLMAMAIATFTFAQNWAEGMQDESVNFYTVQKQFNDYWKGKEITKGSGHKPFKRWEYFMEPRVYPSGVRPDPATLYNTLKIAGVNGTQSQNINLGTWSAIGPFDGPNNFGIGRINSIEFHPTITSRMWVGSPAGGLWKSNNSGTNWKTSTDELTNLGVSDIAVNPLNPSVMYIATGDRDGGDTYSYGILKSTNSGNKWQPTGLSWNVTQQRRIGKIIVHPVDTNIVIAATRSGIYRSVNSGTTWVLEKSGNFNTLYLSKAAPDTIFAGTISSGNARIYRSIDKGNNWSLLSTGLPTSSTRRVEITVSPQDASRVYALFSDPTQAYAGLYQSTNGGNTWTLRSSSPNILGSATSGNGSGGQSWYDLCIEVSPTNKNQVFIGGVNLWRSNNAGSTWKVIGGYSWGGGGNPWVHPDMHYMKFKPGTNTLYVGHDGGVSYTSNGGTSWTHLVDGLNITQYYKMSTSQQSANIMMGGSQDNSTHLLKNNNWTVPVGGDGMDNAINHDDDKYMYASSQYGNFRRSSNYGNSFQYMNSLPPNGQGGWVTPIQLDPVNPAIVYIGYTRLYKSTNHGVTWSSTTSSSVGGQIDVIAVAPSKTSVIYIAYNSTIKKSVNTGNNWSNITNGISGSGFITDIAVSSLNEDHIWITKSGYTNGKKVFESIDGGSTWINVSGSLPNLPANTVQYAAGTNDGIYVGTDIGVYYKDNNLSDWVSFSKDLPNVIVTDLEIYEAGKKLRIATMGRGMWESDLYSELTGPPVSDFVAAPTTTCGLTDTVQLIDKSEFIPTAFNWSIYPNTFLYVNGTSDTSQNPYLVFSAYGDYTVTLTTSNALGGNSATKIKHISVGGKSLPFVENFESELDLTEWSIVNADNGNGWSIDSINGTSPGNKVFKMNHYGYTTLNEVDELISPKINLANLTSASLDFSYAYRRYNATRTDTLEVYISTNCGSTWSLLASYAEDGTGNFSTGTVSQTSAFVPNNSNDWCGGTNASCKSISLAGYLGNRGAQIKFVSINGNGNNLYLDNVNVTGVSSIKPAADFFSDTVACATNNINFYDVSQDGPTSWAWTFTGGTPANSAVQNPTISYANPGTYAVKLVATNTVGSDSITKVSYVTIDSVKAVSINITANNSNICLGDTATYTAIATNPGLFPTYQWLLNGNNIGGNKATLTLNNLSSSDSVWCELISSQECASAGIVISNKLSLNVLPLPQVNFPSLTSVCASDTAFALTGGTPAGGVYSGTGVSNGYFNPSVVVNGSVWITYTYSDAMGCSNSDKSSIFVFSKPVQPTVSANVTNTLHCDQNANQYQWLDATGKDIPTATAQDFTPLTNGTYSVRITDGLSCVNTSLPFILTNIGIDEYLSKNLKIFPNPTENWVNVSFNALVNSEGKIEVTSAMGNVVSQQNITAKPGNNVWKLDLSEQASGVYFIIIKINNQLVSRQLIKL